MADNYFLTEKERAGAARRANQRIEKQIVEREHLRREIKTRKLIEDIENIGDRDYRGNRDAIAEAKLKLSAKETLLDRVLPKLRTIDLDALAQQQTDQVPVVQIVQFGTNKALGEVNPSGGAVHPVIDQLIDSGEGGEPWVN